MTDTASRVALAHAPTVRLNGAIVLLAAALAITLGRGILPDDLIRPPAWMIMPLADWINALFNFLRDDLGLLGVTRPIAGGVEWLLDITANLLYGKNRWPWLGPIPWSVVAATAAVVAYGLGGTRLALVAGGTFVWIAVMGQWKWAMETLSVIVVAAPVSVTLGLMVGIAAWRWRWVAMVINPVLNIAQSLPHFAYMIPVVVFIGVGPKAGAIVTIIFSIPPMIRMTLLGLRKVPDVVVESGQMCGATGWQLLLHTRIPTARADILIGVNQVIMQCLAMVVLASFIGMPGLGQKLLQLLQALKIGQSVEIGITIVLLAITLDRCTKAWALRQPTHLPRGTPWHQRRRLLLIWLSVVAVAGALSQIFPIFAEIGRGQNFSVAGAIDVAMDRLIVAIYPVTDWLRWFLIVWVFIPIRDAFLWMPFAGVLALLMALGYAVGGRRSALICLAFFGYIAITGWWDRSMITVYTVLVSVAIASLLAFPIAIWAAGGADRSRRALLVCDSLQTFPSFIYLIPMIMLFGVNDVAVIGAVVLFAAVPLVRYTVEGLRGVPLALVEAAGMSGATRRQTLQHVLLPVALPTIMVGVNQAVMFSLFMVIIAAFIGTQDLGQEMQRALSSADVGKGLVLGLAVASIGLMVDHLIEKWASSAKRAH